MDLLVFHLDHVNWAAILIALLPSFVLGSLWYSPMLFGKYWQKQVGLKDKDLKKASMAQMLSVTTVMNFVMVASLAVLMCALKFDTVWQGAVFGGLVGLAFAGASRGVHQAFEQKGVGLFLVNTSYDVLFLGTAGAIIGAF